MQWPPPAPSVYATIASHVWASDTLYGAAEKLESMLQRHGYSDLRWYLVPKGFAVATRCERIRKNGTAIDFSAEVPAISEFTLAGIVGSIFKAHKGRFRVMLLTVTSDPGSLTSVEAAGDATTAEMLGHGGGFAIPNELKSIKVDADKHHGLVLFYEIVRTADQQPQVVHQQALTSAAQLWATGLETH